MILSKSFGYTLRGKLYVTHLKDEERKVSTEEIADRLTVPRHFLGKIMKQVVKEGILNPTKGLFVGFSINEETLSSHLVRPIRMTDGTQ